MNNFFCNGSTEKISTLNSVLIPMILLTFVNSFMFKNINEINFL